MWLLGEGELVHSLFVDSESRHFIFHDLRDFGLDFFERFLPVALYFLAHSRKVGGGGGGLGATQGTTQGTFAPLNPKP